MNALPILLLLAQSFEQRGFIENRTLIYPQEAANDPAEIVSQGQVRWDVAYRSAPWLKWNASLDALADTHRQTNRDARINLDDRAIRRPALSLRQWSASLSQGKLTAVIGRQIIRWGKTDILTPTDRFAPRDYLGNVVDSDFLPVIATRVTAASAGDSLDLIWQPWFTPSRTPLLDQRWTVLPTNNFQLIDGGARYPGRSQFGARWNHLGGGREYSLSYFDGFNHLPLFTVRPDTSTPALVFERIYPTMRMVGGDAAIQFPWLTIKGEAGYFMTRTTGAQDYVLYVIQLERQVKEWSFVGGYAGEVVRGEVNNTPRFTPDRGFAKSFVARAALTIDANRSLAMETAVRAGGSFTRFEYVQAFGSHWRVTPGVAWIRGDASDFLGQYRRNSYLSLALRYSF